MSPEPSLADAMDKMMRADLDSWSSFWFWSLVGSTIAVVTGIICEAPEVWQAVGLGDRLVARVRRFWYIRVRKIDLNGWEQLCPELVAKSGRHGKLIARAGLVGWMLVALGVAGEGTAEYFVNDAETEVRSFDNAELAETQRSANSAAAASALAFDFSNKSEVVSASAIKLAKGARKEADSFQQEIAAAKKQADDAQLALTKLKTPRSIKPEDQIAICEKLSAFHDIKFDLYAATDGNEPLTLARTIASVLSCALWVQVDVNNPIGFDSKPRIGVTAITGVVVEVAATRRKEWESAASRAVEALRPSFDIETKFDIAGGDPSAVHIFVGKKPQ